MTIITLGEFNAFKDKLLERNINTTAISKKSLPASFLINLAHHSIEHIKAQIKEVSAKQLIKPLSSTHNGLNALHYAITNKNVEVFNFIAGFIDDHQIDIEKILYSSKYQTVKTDTVVNVLEKDTPLNIALSLAQLDKIKACIEKGYPQINVGNVKTNFLCGIESKTQKGDLLSLCTTLISGENNKTMPILEKVDFYLHFALSIKSFDEYLGLEKYSANNFKNNWEKARFRLSWLSSRGDDHYFPLVYYKPLYENENFVKVFIPYLLKCLNSSIHEEKETCHSYVHSSLAKKLKSNTNFIATIIKNFEASPFTQDKDINDSLSSLLSFLVASRWSDFCDDKDAIAEYIKACDIRSEKALISLSIEKPRANKAKVELKI